MVGIRQEAWTSGWLSVSVIHWAPEVAPPAPSTAHHSSECWRREQVNDSPSFLLRAEGENYYSSTQFQKVLKSLTKPPGQPIVSGRKGRRTAKTGLFFFFLSIKKIGMLWVENVKPWGGDIKIICTRLSNMFWWSSLKYKLVGSEVEQHMIQLPTRWNWKLVRERIPNMFWA